MMRFFRSLWFIGLIVLGVRLAHASTLNRLNQVQLNGKNQIHMVFSEPVNEAKIEKEFRDGLFQISLPQAVVHPAKVLNLSGGDISKVFAYQYTPNLIRTRFSIEGTSDEIKKRVQLKVSGRMITITVAESLAKSKDEIQVQSAQALRMATGPKENTPIEKVETVPIKAKTEDELLEKIKKSESQPITTPSQSNPKKVPSPIRSIIALIFLVTMILAGAWFLKRSKAGMSLMSQLKKKHQMIEVIANQNLGSKRSISVVKIGGRTFVLGVTPESVNLITEITENSTIDVNEIAGSPIHKQKIDSVFQGILEKEIHTEGVGEAASRSGVISSPISRPTTFRDRVRSRIEEMKRL